MRLRAAILALCLAPLAPLASLAGEPERFVLRGPEELEGGLGSWWYGVYFEGKKSGFARLECARGGTPADPTFVSRFTFKAELLVMGERITFDMSEEEVYEGQAPWALRGGVATVIQGAEREERRLERRPGGWRVVVTSGDAAPHAVDVADMTYTLVDELTPTLWIRRQPAKGAALVHPGFDLSEAEVKQKTLTVEDMEERRAEGVALKVWKVKIVDAQEGEEGTVLIDEQGVAIRAELPGLCEMRLEPEEVAKKIEVSGDLFIQGLARIDQPLGESEKLVRLQVRLEGEGREHVPAGPLQSVTKTADGAWELVIDVLGGPKVEAAAEEIARALRATPEAPSEHPEVVRLAQEAIAGATDPRSKAERLVHFVAKLVEDAYGADSLSVLEVIRKKRGDCTEHAALFTALARAAGLPARTVGGLAYMDDETRAFGGHAWNEVVLDGVWVPVDPTFDQVRIDASHLRLSHEGGPDAGLKVHGKLQLILLRKE